MLYLPYDSSQNSAKINMSVNQIWSCKLEIVCTYVCQPLLDFMTHMADVIAKISSESINDLLLKRRGRLTTILPAYIFFNNKITYNCLNYPYLSQTVTFIIQLFSDSTVEEFNYLYVPQDNRTFLQFQENNKILFQLKKIQFKI